MEFAALVAPGGAFWRAWVAAHWERRLKRQDYLAADVKAIAALVVHRLGAISLRCAGCLLLGVCRLLRWKVVQLEEEAEEVRSGLLASASTGHSLPMVATLPESALTLKPVGDVGGAWWGGDSDLFGNGEQLQLLEEPQLATLELKASLEEGKRHVAPLETITLGPEAPLPAPASVAEGPADVFDAYHAFDAPTAADREAMDALSIAEGSQDAPPLDFLLGQSGSRAGLELPSGDLVPSMGPWLGGSGGGLPGITPLDDLGEEPLEPFSTTPRRLVKRLEDEFGSPAAGELRLPRTSTQSSYLARMLEFSPEAPEAAEAVATPGTVAALGDEGAAAPRSQRLPSRPRRKRPKPWLDPVTEIPKAKYHDVTAITSQSLYDTMIFLPHKDPRLGMTATFGEICPLLQEPFLQAPAIGEKRRRALDEQKSMLRELNANAFRNEAASSSSRPAPSPPVPLAPAATAPSPGLPSVPGPGEEEPAASADADALDAVAPLLSPYLNLAAVREDLADLPEGGPADESMGTELDTGVTTLVDDYSSEAPGTQRDETMGLEGVAASPLAPFASLPPTPPLEELGEEGLEELIPPWRASPEAEHSAGQLSPFRSQASSPKEARELEVEFSPLPPAPFTLERDEGMQPVEEPGILDAALAHEDAGAASSGEEPPHKARRVAAEEEGEPEAKGQIWDVLGTLDSDASFEQLCDSTRWQPEEVARSFMGLLTLHMEGVVSLSQDEPYGDVTIGRGPDWLPDAAEGASGSAGE